MTELAITIAACWCRHVGWKSWRTCRVESAWVAGAAMRHILLIIRQSCNKKLYSWFQINGAEVQLFVENWMKSSHKTPQCHASGSKCWTKNSVTEYNYYAYRQTKLWSWQWTGCQFLVRKLEGRISVVGFRRSPSQIPCQTSEEPDQLYSARKNLTSDGDDGLQCYGRGSEGVRVLNRVSTIILSNSFLPTFRIER